MRSKFERWFAIVSVLIVMPVVGLAEAAAATDPPAVRAASHVGRYAEEAIEWKSRIQLRRYDRAEISRVELAAPLPEESEVLEVRPREVDMVRDSAGRVTALRIPARERPWMITLVTRQSFERPGSPAPPMAGPRAPHRVALEGLKFSPGKAGPLVAYPGFVATRDLERAERSKIEHTFDDPPAAAGEPVYFHPDELPGPELTGAATPLEAYRERTIWILGGILALLGLLAGLGYRWLEGRAREEEAEAILREHGEEFGL